MGDDIAPFRVEWRPSSAVRWMFIDSAQDRESADDLARRTLASRQPDLASRRVGYCRLIAQEVIESSEGEGGWPGLEGPRLSREEAERVASLVVRRARPWMTKAIGDLTVKQYDRADAMAEGIFQAVVAVLSEED